ncbi:hypothetical protein SALBM217S_08811 [Streptomyces griseoloalbus]
MLRAARSLADKAQLEAFSTLLPEDQLEVLQYLAEGFGPEEVYRDVVAVRLPAHAPAEPVEDLATVIANTPARIRLVTGPRELEEALEKPFAAWRIFLLHPSQRRVAYRTSYGGPVQVTGGPGTGKTVAALHRVKHLLGRSDDSRVLLTTYTNALAAGLRDMLGLLLDEDETLLARVDVTTVDAYANGVVRAASATAPKPVGDRSSGSCGRRSSSSWICRSPPGSWRRSTGTSSSPRTSATSTPTSPRAAGDAAPGSDPGAAPGGVGRGGAVRAAAAGPR